MNLKNLFTVARNTADAVLEKAKGAALAAVGAVGTAVALAPTSAHAALTLDTTSILADIATVVAFITTVGLAILGLVYVAKSIGWAKKAG